MNQKGIGNLVLLLIVLASFGLILFLLITTTAPFHGFFNRLNPKVPSHADTSFFIGLNISGITDYGYSTPFQFSASSQIDADLAEANRIGAKVIRVFAANENVSDAESANRLNLFLQKAKQYNISVIVSLIDFYGTPFRPQGTSQYYTGSFNGMPLLGDGFFTSGYQDRYKDFVTTMVNSNKNQSNIFAWEIGNELKDDNNPNAFISFMQDMSSYIKTLDPTHNISTGMLNAGHTNLTPDQLYPNLPNINVITVHPYDGDHSGTSDIQWATQNGKQGIVEEIGFSGTGDRSASMHQEIDYWKNVGATGIMQWGFMAKGLSDNGNGDKTYGMDTVWHTDYDQLVSVFQNYVAPGCNQNNVQMSFSPANPKVGQQVTFNLSGSEGSTWVADNWTGGVSCTGGFWGSKSCNATNGGNFTWTHYWKNCVFNNCAITSDQCSKHLTYTIIAPTPTPQPTDVCMATTGRPNGCSCNADSQCFGGDCHTGGAPSGICQTQSTPLPTPVPTPVPGDIDGNGIVDIQDYNMILTNFNKSETPGTNGDLSKNGIVDIQDYNIVLTFFGQHR